MLHIFALCCAVCAISLVWKRRFEQSLPIAVLAALPVLCFLAMLQRLSWVDSLAWAVLAFTLALLAYALLTKRITLAQLGRRFLVYMLTPGFACFALLTAFLLFATQPMVVWWSDDIVHWALSPKSMWIADGLMDKAHNLNMLFSTYTPGIPALQWWMMHALGEWQESTLYFTLFMTYVVLSLPLTVNMRWKQFWLIPLMSLLLLVLPVWANRVSYVFLGVDSALSLCFGYTLIQIWQYQQGDKLQRLAIALGLCGTVLIKHFGLLFALMAVAFMAIAKRGSKKDWLLCALSPVLTIGIWMLYCNVMGFSGFHDSGLSSRIGEMLNGTYVMPNGGDGVAASLLHSLIALDKENLTFNTVPLLHVPKLVWMVVLSLIPWLLSKMHECKALKRISLFFAAMMVLTVLVQFVSFYTVFYYEVDVYVHNFAYKMLLLMERYMAPMILGVGLFDLWLVIDAFPAKFKAVWKPLPALVAAAGALVLVFTTCWGVLYEGMLPSRYIQQDRSIGIQASVMMDNDWGEALLDYPQAHVLAGLEFNSDYPKNLRYVFAPVKFDIPAPDFVENADQVRDYLTENHITHVICFDELSELYAPASQLVQDGGDLFPWSLYEVTATEDGVELVETY